MKYKYFCVPDDRSDIACIIISEKGYDTPEEAIAAYTKKKDRTNGEK